MSEILSAEGRRSLLSEATTVAVLGAHPNPVKPAYYVPDYLHQMGYRIFPVNATRIGETLWGQTVVGALAEIHEPIDFVDVFRASEALPGHLADIAAMSPRPRAVWLQLGIDDETVIQQLLELGIDVVRGACALADHRTFALPPRPATKSGS